jgi:hypothetical protein
MAESFVAVTAGSGTKLHTFQRVIGANTVEDDVSIPGEPYLATYVVSTTVAISLATANSHVYQVMAGASLNLYIRRIRIYQVGLATASALIHFQLWRLTTAGTGGTAHGSAARDSTDAAAGFAGMDLPTVKGTEGAFIDAATAMLIQTVPLGGPGQASLIAEWDFDLLRTKPPRIPAGAANGIALKNTTGAAAATVVPVFEITEANF